MKIKREFEPYWNWECFKHGMYNDTNDDKETLIAQACELLSNRNKFWEACESVLSKWVVSAKVHLTNTDSNRQSYLGQAACCLLHNVPEVLTRSAWARLTSEQQQQANEVADYWIDFYERKTREACVAVDATWLPGWNTG